MPCKSLQILNVDPICHKVHQSSNFKLVGTVIHFSSSANIERAMGRPETEKATVVVR